MMDEYEDFFGNDEFDRDPSPKGDEAIEVPVPGSDIPSGRVVKPPTRTVKRFVMNENLLAGPKGISALKAEFENFQPGSDPYQNLSAMMKKYNHWGHLMFPNMKFEDLINRCETLGTRRMVKVHLTKMRLGMPLTDEDFQGDVEKEKKSKKKEREEEIIDDGADDDEVIPAEDNDNGEETPNNEKEKTPEKHQKVTEEVTEEEEEYMREMEHAEQEDELMADFDW